MGHGLTSSGLLSADAQIISMPGQLFTAQLLGDGTNAATLTIYDSENSTTSGKLVLAKITLDAGLVQAEHLVLEHSLVANRGIYCDVSGTGAEYIIGYVLGA